MADKAKIAGEILGGMGPGLLSGIGAALVGPDKTPRPGSQGPPPIQNPPVAKPSGFKHGGKVEKTGLALVHKGETVIPEGKSMAKWTDGSTGLKGKGKAPKKEIHEIRTRKAKSGGFVHEHHHTHPEAHPMEEHVSPDQDAMVQHMMQSMGSGGDPNADPNAGAAPPDPNAAAGGPPAAPPAGPPAAAPPAGAM